MKTKLFAALVLTWVIASCRPSAIDANSLYRSWRDEYEAFSATPPGSKIEAIHLDLLPTQTKILSFPSFLSIVNSTDGATDGMILSKLRPYALRDKKSVTSGDEFLGFAYCLRQRIDYELLLAENGLKGRYYELSRILCEKFDPAYQRVMKK
jgi:hypothetical protein